jgi:hypothetical protein
VQLPLEGTPMQIENRALRIAVSAVLFSLVSFAVSQAIAVVTADPSWGHGLVFWGITGVFWAGAFEYVSQRYQITRRQNENGGA